MSKVSQDYQQPSLFPKGATNLEIAGQTPTETYGIRDASGDQREREKTKREDY
jgi:hypothetical protein